MKKWTEKIKERMPRPLRRYASAFGGFLKKIQEDRIGGLAAEMAYFLLFAFFPFLIVLFVLLSYVQIDIAALADFLNQLLPEDIANLVLGIVREVTANKNLALLSIGVLTAFWAAINGTKALILGVNVAYDNPPTKGFFRPYLIAMIATIGIPLIVVITLVFQVAGETITRFIETYFTKLDLILWVLRKLGTVIPLVATGLYFLLFYRIAPNVRVRFRDVIFGTVFTTIAWFAASSAFSVYINQFANYSRFYGSIGSVIILLFWLYITSMMILLGAEINAAVGRFRGNLKVEEPACEEKQAEL